MFPSSNSTSNYQLLPFPCNTNQTQLLEKSFASIIDHHGHENPNSVSHDSHQYYSQYSDDQQLAPNFLEHDGMLLSYLLSQQQLLFGNCSTNNGTSHHTQAHENTEISFVASNSNKAIELNHADDHEETIIPAAAASKGSSSTINKKSIINGEGKKAKVPRKRSSGKKDRHSKIYTAQGPRDRRMRLSLQIARKFFDLQDMLGFDKASNTIEWLFTKSKTAIKELKQHLIVSPVTAYSSTSASATPKINSSTSDNSEVASKTMETGSTANGNVSVGMARDKQISGKLCVVAKEARVEARAWARERTREKKMRNIRSGFDHDHHQNSTKQSPDHPVLPNPNDQGGHCLWPSNCHSGDQLLEPGMMNSMMMTINHDKVVRKTSRGAPRPFLNFDYSSHGSDLSGANSKNCDFPGFPGNWGGINNNMNITGKAVLQIDQKPTGVAITPTSYPKKQKPSSIFITSTQEQNPTSVFITPP